MFLIDDPEGSERLAMLHSRTVTAGAFIASGHPKGVEGELVIRLHPTQLMLQFRTGAVSVHGRQSSWRRLERGRYIRTFGPLRDGIAARRKAEDSIESWKRAKEAYGDRMDLGTGVPVTWSSAGRPAAHNMYLND
ncbi:MAG: hypothetical protein ACLTSX_02350 [Collinsella sp.]